MIQRGRVIGQSSGLTSNLPNNKNRAVADTNNTDPRISSRLKWYNGFDPVYRFLDHILFARLFRPKNQFGIVESLPVADAEFLVDNLQKHRLIVWLNLGLAVYLASWGLKAIASTGDPAVVVTGLLAPAMITGAAWYTVSFGGIPEKFLNVALVLTFWMFLSFSLSMTLLVGLLCSLTPWPVGLFVLIPIYLALYVASVLYDNLDGLKIGLDSTLLKYSRAALTYYQKHGYVTREESQADKYESTDSEDIALFNHHIAMLEKNLTLLGEDKTPRVANRLVASATDLIFQIIDHSLSKNVDRDDQYHEYVARAHLMKVEEVDEATIRYLRIAIVNLEAILGSTASKNIQGARALLSEFEELRTNKDEAGKPLVDQVLADHLFSQVFQQILSLMMSHRQLFFVKSGQHT